MTIKIKYPLGAICFVINDHKIYEGRITDAIYSIKNEMWKIKVDAFLSKEFIPGKTMFVSREKAAAALDRIKIEDSILKWFYDHQNELSKLTDDDTNMSVGGFQMFSEIYRPYISYKSNTELKELRASLKRNR